MFLRGIEPNKSVRNGTVSYVPPSLGRSDKPKIRLPVSWIPTLSPPSVLPSSCILERTLRLLSFSSLLFSPPSLQKRPIDCLPPPSCYATSSPLIKRSVPSGNLTPRLVPRDILSQAPCRRSTKSPRTPTSRHTPPLSLPPPY